MSDEGIVGFDKRFGGRMMKAITDTMGMDRPEQAAFWLEKISAKLHRGPRVDTWASARDRAAKRAGISPSMASRIWHRWRDMKDVSGDALYKLMLAYEELFAIDEAALEAARAEHREFNGETEKLARLIAHAVAAEAR